MINKIILFVFTLLSLSDSRSSIVRFNKLSDDINNASIQVIRNIITDESGFLWIATGYSGLYKYDGYNLLPIKLNEIGLPLKINQMSIDKNGLIWVGTKQNGLFGFNTNYNEVTEFNSENSLLISNTISFLLSDYENGLWIGTDKGLILKTFQGDFIRYPKSSEQDDHYFVKSILKLKDKNLLVATDNGLYLLDKKQENVSILNKINDLIISVMFQDKLGQMWLGTKDGLYFSKSYNNQFEKVEGISQRVSAITHGDKHLWVGTYYAGVYKISANGHVINNYRYDPSDKDSLSDNSILSLLYDNSRVLWVSTFNNGISYFDTKASNFGLSFDSSSSVYCANNNVNFNFYEDKLNNIWISTENGLVKFNSRNKTCELYQADSKNPNTLSNSFIRHVHPFKENHLWVSTNRGFNLFNIKTGNVKRINIGLPKVSIFFSTNLSNEQLLIGTELGLYKYSIVDDKAIQFPTNNDVMFYNYIKDKYGNYFFPTNKGVYKLDLKDNLTILSEVQNHLPNVEILSLHIDKNSNLWVGTWQRGLFRFNHNNKLDLHYTKKHGLSEYSTIYSILEDDQNNLWIGTTEGLAKLNTETNLAHVFQKKDGLQGDFFNKASAYKSEDGKLYFGGRTGFNAFYPEDIKLNNNPPNIVLTDFTRFGKSVEVGSENEDFLLKKDINELQELSLTHRDYVIGFEFSALDFADPSRNKYAYMMEGLDPEWIYTDANNRRISYSNLSSGNYNFRVKGSNKDGVWNEKGKSLKIIVKPAPWFSWWAYSIYVLTFSSFLAWYINRKNRANKKITNMLRIEVAKQTREIKGQKLKVENLLAQKNELFANVSHEFRTPLTLILGPINKLLNTNLPHSSINDLKMVNRNANRLLTMIEQLLQLAKVSSEAKPQFFSLKTKRHIVNIVDSFQPLAQQKRIDLLLEKNDESAISTTSDALEIILGNLISNAIKYTQSGGRVSVISNVLNGKLEISVTDTGSGLNSQQKKDIFNRFERLDLHQNIQGIGIGLSVVESLLAINNGSIDISSESGKGSTFMISFDTVSLDFEESTGESNSLLLNQLVHESTEVNYIQKKQKPNANKQNDSILIIEDNNDMRDHIEDTLKDSYHCLQADRGKAGIALAIKHVPDIIICDVMMPEMDGFQVSRVIRSDTRTSHIPLVLLTALHDKESRIKGWREHVDVYLTKPFDAQELLLQLENILVIRSILKAKAGKNIRAGKNIKNSDLPKKDQIFINKINEFIKKKYQNPLYLRQQMASDMAVSERQLQRKLKALIDKNPMDLLREYRLSKAANMLKDGYQVGITSDECGFNSVAYFSQCFKAQFGLSPKVYQTSCKKTGN